jgi:hypothetical protein
VIALKCLLAGGIAPFSRLAWPLPGKGEPGAWVEAEPDRCASGVHACLARSLPYWLTSEVWTIELDGVEHGERKLVARRGRLLQPVEAWNGETESDFALDCAARAAALAAGADSLAAYAEDARACAAAGRGPVSGFIAARLAELVGGTGAYEAERTAQARWLAERLELRTLY